MLDRQKNRSNLDEAISGCDPSAGHRGGQRDLMGLGDEREEIAAASDIHYLSRDPDAASNFACCGGAKEHLKTDDEMAGFLYSCLEHAAP